MRKQFVTICCSSIFVVCLSSVYLLQKQLDKQLDKQLGEEVLYLSSGKTIRKLSLGFDGLVADLYWIRTVQYFGRKLVGELDQEANVARLNKQNLSLLSPLLEIVTTVDPQNFTAYSYGANFLGEFDLEAAIHLLKKGITTTKEEVKNKSNNTKFQRDLCRLYQQLGYTYWRAKMYKESSQAYEEGSLVPNSPIWMKAMAAVMQSQGGDRSVAYTVFEQMMKETEDETIKATLDYRIRHLISLDERDFLNQMLAEYVSQTKNCASSFQQILPLIRQNINKAMDSHSPSKPLVLRFNSSGIPLDPGPSPQPYIILPSCHASLSSTSNIPKTWDPQ